MRPIAGTYGNITSDEYLHAQRIEHTADGLAVTWFDGSTIMLPDGAPKIDLPAIPAAFRRNVWKRRIGGGAANSRIAAGFIAEAVGGQNEIRHLDGNRFYASIASELPPPARTLDLRESSINYVFSDSEERRIYRSPLEPAGPLAAQQFADIQWLLQAQTILVNSPKDEEPVGAIIEGCGRTGSEVVLVLTSSLYARFWKSGVLRAQKVRVVIAAVDDLQFLAGGFAVSIGGAAMAAASLREMAPGAEIHVTMGSLGVLSMAAGSDEMTHVVLDARASAAPEVLRIVKEQPARLNGAGDAFAGGLLAHRAFGWSLLAGSEALLPHVQAALASCASALRWIGVRSGLKADAFAVRALPVAVGA